MNLLSRLSLAVASCYLRRVPVPYGRWRIIKHLLPELRKYGKDLGERVVLTRYGFRYKADLGDWLGQYVYLTGVYEPPTAHVIAALLESGDTFIDVGANSGIFTLLASKRVGPNGRVLSFEPVPSMRGRIIENLTLNRMENVILHGVALSNTVGEITFYEGPQGHKGLSSMRPIEDVSTTLRTPTLPLDDLTGTTPSVKLIKIDVEGAEQLVVEGMEKLLAQQHPYVIIEMTDQYLKAFGHSTEGLSTILRRIGYNMHKIMPEGLIKILPGQESDDPQYNALFSLHLQDDLLQSLTLKLQ